MFFCRNIVYPFFIQPSGMCPAKLRFAHPSHSLTAAGPSRSRGHGRPRFCRGTYRTDYYMKNG